MRYCWQESRDPKAAWMMASPELPRWSPSPLIFPGLQTLAASETQRSHAIMTETNTSSWMESWILRWGSGGPLWFPPILRKRQWSTSQLWWPSASRHSWVDDHGGCFALRINHPLSIFRVGWKHCANHCRCECMRNIFSSEFYFMGRTAMETNNYKTLTRCSWWSYDRVWKPKERSSHRSKNMAVSHLLERTRVGISD